MSIGINKWEVETPALLIDLDLMEYNIKKMKQYFSTVNSKLRAHAKTHKSPIIAHKQIEAGSHGICCQKLGEAEVMVNAGIKDIFITNEVVSKEKIERLIMINRHANVKIAIDNLEIAKIISKAAIKRNVQQDVLVEVDVRNKRCGVAPGKPTLDLVKEVIKLKGLRFRGLMGYEGPFFGLINFEERKRAAYQLLALLKETIELVESEGIEVEIVSAGSTGTYNITAEYPRVTEIEAGSYVFMDSTYRKLGLEFKCALTVLTTIISRPTPTRIIVDVGLKGITTEFGMPIVKDKEKEAVVYHLSEEHGLIEVDPKVNFKVGDKIELIPSHCCTTVNLHERYYGVRDDVVEVIWPILARGKFQ